MKGGILDGLGQVEGSDDSDLEGEELAEGVEAPGLQKSTKRVKREAYEQWKSKVHAEAEKSKEALAKSTKLLFNLLMFRNSSKVYTTHSLFCWKTSKSLNYLNDTCITFF